MQQRVFASDHPPNPEAAGTHTFCMQQEMRRIRANLVELAGLAPPRRKPREVWCGVPVRRRSNRSLAPSGLTSSGLLRPCARFARVTAWTKPFSSSSGLTFTGPIWATLHWHPSGPSFSRPLWAISLWPHRANVLWSHWI